MGGDVTFRDNEHPGHAVGAEVVKGGVDDRGSGQIGSLFEDAFDCGHTVEAVQVASVELK
jgi:hypothetical protein